MVVGLELGRRLVDDCCETGDKGRVHRGEGRTAASRGTFGAVNGDSTKRPALRILIASRLPTFICSSLNTVSTPRRADPAQ